MLTVIGSSFAGFNDAYTRDGESILLVVYQFDYTLRCAVDLTNPVWWKFPRDFNDLG